MKTVAFLSHSKSLKRIIPDVEALRQLNVKILLLVNPGAKMPVYINEDEIFYVDLNDIRGIAELLSKFNIDFLTTPSDHLFVNVVKICNILKIETPCTLETAELFLNKFSHIQHAITNGLSDHVPRTIYIDGHSSLNDLPNRTQKSLFIKPEIGCGMRGVFESSIPDDQIFEYKGIKNAQALIDTLRKHNLTDEFIKYCKTGIDTSYYYPEKPKALIQECYYTNKSYTFQYSVLNGKWHYNTIGQLFCWAQKDEFENNRKIDPLQDPRLRITNGSTITSEEIGYYHLSAVPDHIYPFFKKCVDYMKRTYSINNMSFTLAIHETIDGEFYLTDLNPRVGGQWTVNHKFSQPEFYLRYWNAILHKSMETFNHIGPLGCVNSLLLDTGIIEHCIIPADTPKLIISGKDKLRTGVSIPEIQSLNSKKWEVKIHTCGDSLDDQIKSVLSANAFIRNNIKYYK